MKNANNKDKSKKNFLKEKQNLKIIIDSIVTDVLKEEKHNQQFVMENSGPIGSFLGPLSDIVKTATYGLKKLTTVASRNLLKIAGHLGLLLIPFIASSEIKKIDKMVQKQIDTRLSQLDNEYKDVLTRNMQALQTQDVSIFAFFTNPGAYLTAAAGVTGIKTAIGILETLTLGNPKVTALKNKVNNASSNSTSFNGTSKGGGGGSMGGGYGDFGGDFGGDIGGMYESNNNNVMSVSDLRNQVSVAITELLKDPEIQQAIKNNPIVGIVDNAKIISITDRASELMKIKSYDELQSFIGPDFNKIKNEVIKNTPKDLSKEELISFNQSLVPEIKRAYNKVYIKYLADMSSTSQNPHAIDKAIQFITDILPTLK